MSADPTDSDAATGMASPVEADDGPEIGPSVEPESSPSAASDRFPDYVAETTGTDRHCSEGLMTQAEAAVYLRCTDRTIRNYIARGELTARRHGRHVRVLRIEVENLYRSAS